MELSRTIALLEEQMREGLHVGYQIYCSVGFREVLSAGAGVGRGDGTELNAETLMLWMSAGKPVTAVGIAQLWERGLVDLDDAVAKFIPEFGQQGKGGITLRHCLTHTGGFRGPLNNFTTGTWEEIIARICKLKPEAPAGTLGAYHAGTSWFILGEIVQRVSGVNYSQYVRERIFLPLGMKDCWIGMPGEEYERYGERLAMLPNMESEVVVWETAANTELGTTVPRPGANGRGPMQQLGRFYEMLLKKGMGVISPVTVDAMTAPHRVGMWDASFQHKIDFGLGFLINSNHYGEEGTPYQYGKYASGRTFGHSGNQSSVGFADPENNLVVCLAFNGMPGEGRHQGRVREVLGVVYEELGLGSGEGTRGPEGRG